MSATLTQLRKAPEGTTVQLSKATFVRFKRTADKTWAEVPRPRVEPRTLTTSELFTLGVDVLRESD